MIVYRQLGLLPFPDKRFLPQHHACVLLRNSSLRDQLLKDLSESHVH